ncbi:MAG: phosphoribosylformylglycinamidine synthase I [Clostridia bacterium]|nr:phosphoribosylformylglycinamidine synthase I [Clostridia bacterium]
MKFGVIVFPGSSGDRDIQYILKEVINKETDYIWHQDQFLKGFDCVVLPGGSAHGDYLRAGAAAAHSPIMDAVRDFAGKGGLVLGICNGFQILLEAGLLPGAVLKNNDLRFNCRDVYLRVENSSLPMTNLYKPGEIIKMPIAHGVGNYYIDNQGYSEMEENGQVVFRYCNSRGEIAKDVNPNGSLGNIAGIANSDGNVLGIMPHPERSSDSIVSGTDGARVFLSAVKWLERGDHSGQ